MEIRFYCTILAFRLPYKKYAVIMNVHINCTPFSLHALMDSTLNVVYQGTLLTFVTKYWPIVTCKWLVRNFLANLMH